MWNTWLWSDMFIYVLIEKSQVVEQCLAFNPSVVRKVTRYLYMCREPSSGSVWDRQLLHSLWCSGTWDFCITCPYWGATFVTPRGMSKRLKTIEASAESSHQTHTEPWCCWHLDLLCHGRSTCAFWDACSIPDASPRDQYTSLTNCNN